MKLFHHDVVALAKKTVHEILDDNVLGLSAECAYNFFFGLFPFLLFAAPVVSLIGDRVAVFNAILARIAPSVPPEALTLIRGVLKDVVFSENAPGLMSIGAALSLWAGAGMFSSFMGALNDAYDVRETRPWWKQKVIAIVSAIVSLFLLFSSTAVMLGGQQIIDLVVRLLRLGAIGATLWTIAQYLLAFSLVVLFVWMLLTVLPDIHHPPRATLPGAILATIAWTVFTVLFRLYVSHFGSYNKTYGTIGAVIVLLTWMYWTCFAILVGGELNSELFAGTGAIPSAANADTRRSANSDRVATSQGLPHSSTEPRERLGGS